jgi:hypothetical protein
MTRYSVDECEAAFNNAEIDEDTLIRMFRSCTNPYGLVERAMDSDHERAVQLLISPHFCNLTKYTKMKKMNAHRTVAA